MVNQTNLTEPFAFKDIIINTFLGSLEVFALVLVLVVALAGAFFALPGSIIILLFALTAAVFSQYVGGVFLILILVLGYLAFWVLKRMVNR